MKSRTDVVVSYLPVGSQRATEWYAERAIEAGCAFVNCIPVFIASDPAWRQRFELAGLRPVVVRAILMLMAQRGLSEADAFREIRSAASSWPVSSPRRSEARPG